MQELLTPQLKYEIKELIDERIRERHVTREDFTELKEIVKNLGITVTNLGETVRELGETVRELSIAQKRTEEKIEELAVAQKRTEEEIRELVISHKDLKKQVGGISHTIGFRLEDESYKALPRLLEKDFGIIVKESLNRRYIKDKEGKYIEINIIGKATKEGKPLTIIGEAKSRISKKDIDDFIRKKLKRINGISGEIFPILVTYMTQEYDVEAYAKKKGIALYYSYNF